ncbi:MAG: ATP-binding protein [Nitriliruptorales bacterium]
MTEHVRRVRNKLDLTNDRAVVVRDESGRPAYSQGVAADVTRAKHAEAALAEQRATLDAIVEASPVVMVAVALDGDNRFVSPAVRTVAGRDPAELEGEPALRFFHPDDVPGAAAGFADMLAGRTDDYRGLLRYQHTDGGWLTVDCHGVVVRDDAGAPTGFGYAMSDVTETVQLTRELHAAKEAAEAANRAKSEFLSRMSHELRTPLNAVLGFAQMLEMGELTGEQRDSVGHILGAGEHLLALIDEVLEIARIEAGALTVSLEPVPVASLVAEVTDLLAPQATRRAVTLDTEHASAPDRVALADPQRLKQVLLNLVANAIKYNRAGGTVTVSSTPAAQGRLRLVVTDTGRGIAPELQERVFSPFDRLDADRSTVPGTGLGLAVSRRLVEAMGGTIGVDSAPGQGSTFWVELAAADAAPHLDADPPPPRRLPGHGLSGRVLYIEDKPVQPAPARDAPRPLPLHPAHDGDAGPTRRPARPGRPPDLVLLDLDLPDLRGEEVLTLLRHDARTRDVPVVILSADATPRQIERLRAAGVHDYLTKPIDVAHLLAAISRHLAASSSTP